MTEARFEAVRREAEAAAQERRRRRALGETRPASLPAAAWIPVIVWLSLTSTILIHFMGMAG